MNEVFPIRLMALLRLPSQLQLRLLLLSLRHARPLRLSQSLRLSLMPSVWLQVPLQHVQQLTNKMNDASYKNMKGIRDRRKHPGVLCIPMLTAVIHISAKQMQTRDTILAETFGRWPSNLPNRSESGTACGY
jgi:hypothetical protein